MEVSVPIHLINSHNIYFTERKKNVIVEGDFTKIIYSNDSFEMNGLYITLDFLHHTTLPFDISHSDDTVFSDYYQNIKGSANKTQIHSLTQIDDGSRSLTEMNTNKTRSLKDDGSLHIHRSLTEMNSNSNLFDFFRRGFSEEYEVENKRSACVPLAERVPLEDYSNGWEVCKKPVRMSMRIPSHIPMNRFITDPQTDPKSRSYAKRIIAINLSSRENMRLIEKLCEIENAIIERYISEHCPSKIATYILKSQLLGGTIKYHSETTAKTHRQKNGSDHFILKISGVWETSSNVGITMKFILL